MKKIIFSSVSIAFLLFSAGCKKKSDTEKLVGDWKVSSLTVVDSDSSSSTLLSPAALSVNVSSNNSSLSGTTLVSTQRTKTLVTENVNETYATFSGSLSIKSDGTFSYTFSSQRTAVKSYTDGVLNSTTPYVDLANVSLGKGVWEWATAQSSNSVLKLKDINLGTAYGIPFDSYTVKSLSENTLELSFTNVSESSTFPNSNQRNFSQKLNNVYIKLTK